MVKDRSNIFLLIFIIFVLAAVYFWYTQFRTPATDASLAAGQQQLVGREFVVLINKLKAITINTDFFSEPKFTSLKDLTPIIELPQQIGRDNPFAPF